MKTDEQMTNDILCRVAANREEQRKKNRTFRRAGCAALSLLLAAGAIFGAQRFPLRRADVPVAQTAETAGGETAAVQTHGLLLFVADAAAISFEDVSPAAHGTDVSLPVHGFLAAETITGLGQPEIETVAKRYMQRARELGDTYGCRSAQTENRLLCLALGEQFAVRAEDPQMLESLTIACGGAGVIDPHATLYAGGSKSVGFTLSAVQETQQTLFMTGAQYRAHFAGENAAGFRFQWFLSEESLAAFEADETLSPSAISDVITVSARYTDGAEESFTITIGFEEDGSITARYTDRLG